MRGVGGRTVAPPLHRPVTSSRAELLLYPVAVIGRSLIILPLTCSLCISQPSPSHSFISPATDRDGAAVCSAPVLLLTVYFAINTSIKDNNITALVSAAPVLEHFDPLKRSSWKKTGNSQTSPGRERMYASSWPNTQLNCSDICWELRFSGWFLLELDEIGWARFGHAGIHHNPFYSRKDDSKWSNIASSLWNLENRFHWWVG